MAKKFSAKTFKEKIRPKKGKSAKEPVVAGKPVAGDKAQTSGQSRAVIEVSTREYVVNEQALNVLSQDKHLFQRTGSLVHVLSDNGPVIRTVPAAMLRELLSKLIHFERQITKEANSEPQKRAVHPPAWCVAAIEARGDWPGIQRLEGVCEYPVILRDGSILSRPGYDPASKLYLEWEGKLSMSKRPDRRDAAAARDTLYDVVCDFPFASPADRSGWVAGLLTPLARWSYFGPAPLFMVDANTPGSGKGLACDCIHMIVTGRQASLVSYPDSNEERRKVIFTQALSGRRLIVLDNLTGRFGDAVLDMALTATSIQDRVMHSQRPAEVPLYLSWYATGNNLRYVGDIGRRICPVRLDSRVEKPELRTGFKRRHLLRWVEDNRAVLLGAALTILHAYHCAGRPEVEYPSWGSYEAWSAAVRAPMIWAGLPDPFQARKSIAAQTDNEAQAMSGALELWASLGEGLEFSAKELIDNGELFDQQAKELRDLLVEQLRKPDAQLLGNLLSRYRHRVLGGRFLACRVHRGTNRWFVLPESDLPKHLENLGK